MQQLNSVISDITAWLEKTEAELEALKMAKPPSDIQELELRVKRLQVVGRGCLEGALLVAWVVVSGGVVKIGLSHITSGTGRSAGAG